MKLLLVANTDWFLYNFHLAHAEFMREMGYEVVLVSPPGDYVNLLQARGFAWRNWTVGRKSLDPIQEIRSLSLLAQIYRSEHPDLVHHFTIKPVLYGSLAARLEKINRVVNSITGRGYIFLSKSIPARMLRPGVIFLYRYLLRGTQVIFENREDQAYFINQKLARAAQSHLVTGVGADPRRFTPTPEPDGPPLVLYAGRLLWDKGIGELVQAGQLLRERGVKFRLAFAGETDPGNPASIPPSTLENWVEDGQVEWLGFQTRLEETFQNCHLVVLPSYGEGVPTVLIEAAAAGRPIVASDVAGCREVVQHGVNGILVPPRDPTALAQALETLIGDASRRREMGLAGRDIFLQKFTHEIINRQTLGVYQTPPDARA